MDYIILALTALAAGAQNSLAGGGTLYTFPALEYFIGAVKANATSTVALVPGSIAGAWGFRGELQPSHRWLTWLVPPSLVGGAFGTWLVVAFPENIFKILVPWLILLATALFLFQPWIARLVGAGKPHAEPSAAVKLGVVFFQFLVAVYGGYFGAGIGILMISSLSLMGLGDIHRVNALKTVLAACINLVSVAIWALHGLVVWKFVPFMALAAILGGYLGARFSRRLNKSLLRWLIIAIGFGLAAYYFTK
jgi:uncharacterized membrane protein YfcA